VNVNRRKITHWSRTLSDFNERKQPTMSMIYFNGRPQLLLHYAVRTCNAAYVSWILRLSNARDDIDMVDENGQTALTTALITGANLGIVDLLVRGGAYVSIEDLLFAARRINTNLLRKLCDGNRTHGQVINRTDVHGWNALQRAIAENLGNRTVLALLENGADPIPVDPSGWTVLLRAISNNRDSNVVSTLLTKNADPNASEPDSWTALHAAVRYNREYIIIAALLRRGADPNAINPDGKTALCAGNFLTAVFLWFLYETLLTCISTLSYKSS
jgi:ankyrin repeat protein